MSKFGNYWSPWFTHSTTCREILHNFRGEQIFWPESEKYSKWHETSRNVKKRQKCKTNFGGKKEISKVAQIGGVVEGQTTRCRQTGIAVWDYEWLLAQGATKKTRTIFPWPYRGPDYFQVHGFLSYQLLWGPCESVMPAERTFNKIVDGLHIW